jgi:hypothetical protein
VRARPRTVSLGRPGLLWIGHPGRDTQPLGFEGHELQLHAPCFCLVAGHESVNASVSVTQHEWPARSMKGPFVPPSAPVNPVPHVRGHNPGSEESSTTTTSELGHLPKRHENPAAGHTTPGLSRPTNR